MNAKEIILRNLQCNQPERLGFSFNKGRRNDFVWSGISPSFNWQQKRRVEDGFEYYDDEWGNIWFRVVGKSKGGEIYQPFLEDWDLLPELRLPDWDDSRRYEKAKTAFAGAPDKFPIAHLPGFPFAICRYLRKMEIYLQDLILERDKIEALHWRVADMLKAMIKGFADAGALGIFFCEDWGTQDRLLISPAMWRAIFKPLYASLCGFAQDHNLKILMHSCGYNWEILGDLAEIGVNAFQFDQQHNYGVERLADRLREIGVCLFSPIDIQKILPTGDRDLIEQEAERLCTLFKGGFIAKNYGDLHGIGVKEEWDEWAYQVFLKRAE